VTTEVIVRPRESVANTSERNGRLRVPRIAHLPASLDLATVVGPQRIDYAAFIVSRVVMQRYLDRNATANTPVPLASAFLRKTIPGGAGSAILKDLIQNGALETDGRYRRGEDGEPGECRRFCIGERYRADPIIPRPLTHPELIRKLEDYVQRERDELKDPVHRKLRDWHDRIEVMSHAPYGQNPLLDVMIQGERRLKPCPQGRVHSNVSNLPAQYRQFLRIDGQPLEVVDVATAQPLLMGHLLEGLAERAEQARWRRKKEEEGREKSRRVLLANSSDSDLRMYVSDCLSATLYENLVDDTGYPREVVKGLLLAVMYGHPNDMCTKVGLAFKARYPAVFAAVAQLNLEWGHGSLPREMQRLESTVMIDRVVRRLIREQPRVPLVTIYDGIMAPPGNGDWIEQVIAEEWKALFGHVPRLKRSMFTDEQPARVHRRRRQARRARTSHREFR